MINILIDSDIILDNFLDREPFSHYSSKILSLCEDKKLNGFVTGLAVANINYVLRKGNNQSSVLKAIKHLLSFLDVIVIDRNVILKSIDSEFSDFEDALQNFSAVGQENINAIITRNIRDYKKAA